MKSATGFWATVRRELHLWSSRRIYLFGMIIVPIGMALFFLNMMREGLPLRVPSAVVDMDHSSMSRNVTRALGAGELVDITEKYDTYVEALDAVRQGEVFGFFVIPENFEHDALNGTGATIEYYSNLTYYIPGSLAFKGFKTISVTTAGSVVRTRLMSMGADSDGLAGLIQPVSVDQHLIGNPWMNYSYYLSPSFISCTLSLMIILMTVFGITNEIKRGTSVQWVQTAGGRMGVALAGKLVPQFVVFGAVGLLLLWMQVCYCHFPMNGSVWWMALAMLLLVVASQAFGLIIAELLPNPRLGLSVAGLLSILAYSLAGFSFPVQNMYGAIGIFSYILPIRHFFLVYINQALCGFDIYYVRWSLAALLLFPLVSILGVLRLKKACLHPVYVP